jgi:cyclic pyranopterin phosphate synthase
MRTMTKLSHLDDTGAARMVDVSAKDATERQAAAEAVIVLSEKAYDAAVGGTGPKGDVLAAARIAGIMAAKKTSDLIPLCHPIAITKAGVDFEPLAERHALRILATVKTLAQTGVEMEALTAASVAALTVYDMIKAVDRSAVIEGVRLVSKSGGKSGSYFAATGKTAPPRLNAPRKAAALMNEVAAPRVRDADAGREAFRAFMTAQRLRATEWAKQAGVPPAQIYAYLTGKARALSPDTVKKLARAAGVREEDLFK